MPFETVATPAIKNENINFAVVVKLDAEGKIVPKSVRHTSSEKDIATLKSAEYKGDETIAFEQTVIAPRAGTLDGFAELITDPEERLNIINKGLSAKFNQKIRTALIELDENGALAFQPVEPTYDATPLVQEPALRVNMTPYDKAAKMLSGLSEEMRAAILAQFTAANASKSE
jgi:hypothetical protein